MLEFVAVKFLLSRELMLILFVPALREYAHVPFSFIVTLNKARIVLVIFCCGEFMVMDGAIISIDRLDKEGI